MARNLLRLLKDRRQQEPPRPSPPEPAVSTVAYEPTDGSHLGKHVLITAFGCNRTRLADLVASTSAIIRKDGQFPVLAGVDLPIEFLVASAIPVETLPSRKDLHLLDEREYIHYVSERWKIILGKWKIRETLDLGFDFDEFLNNETIDP